MTGENKTSEVTDNEVQEPAADPNIINGNDWQNYHHEMEYYRQEQLQIHQEWLINSMFSLLGINKEYFA